VAVPVSDVGDVRYKNLLGSNYIKSGDKVLVSAETMMGVCGSMVRAVWQYQHIVGAHYVEEPVPSYPQLSQSWT